MEESGISQELRAGPPQDKRSAIFLSEGSARPGGTHVLLEHDLVMLACLVVMALPITRREDDLEEITHLTLPLFFISSPKMVTRYLFPALLKEAS